MNHSRTHSLSDSLSAHGVTHDRKGREGKGREGVVTHCMTSTTGSDSTRGGLDVSSCNATNSIEHLDYDHQPPCEAEPGWHDTIPPADWSLHISAPCGHRLEPTFALLCDGCRQWYVDHPKAAGCGRCLGPVRLRFEPLR